MPYVKDDHSDSTKWTDRVGARSKQLLPREAKEWRRIPILERSSQLDEQALEEGQSIVQNSQYGPIADDDASMPDL